MVYLRIKILVLLMTKCFTLHFSDFGTCTYSHVNRTLRFLTRTSAIIFKLKDALNLEEEVLYCFRFKFDFRPHFFRLHSRHGLLLSLRGETSTSICNRLLCICWTVFKGHEMWSGMNAVFFLPGSRN